MNIEKIKVKARFFKAIAFFIFFLICVSAALLISPFTPEEKHHVNSQKTTELLPVKPAQNSPVYKSEKSQNFYNPENDIKQDIDIQPDNNSYILLFSSDKAGISSTDETGSGTGQKENFGVEIGRASCRERV